MNTPCTRAFMPQGRGFCCGVVRFGRMGGHGAWEMNQKQLPLVILFSLFFSSSFLQTRRVHAHTQDPHRAKMHRLGATKMSKTCIFRQSTARDCTHTDAGGLSRKSAFLPSCFAETLKRVATHAMLPRFRSRRVCEASIADWHSGCGNSTGKARTFSARTLSPLSSNRKKSQSQNIHLIY